MKFRTNVNAGGTHVNHNPASAGLRVKSATKAGGLQFNHNQASA